ncbi:hypothetical protein [Pseudomonas cichorii]|uniref:Uncharacterized protein n=1 Tax=Pseudomonas cichorii TaxID=36746 RepID=A0ABQ1DIJ7_PSECI|nr:hypothetical protein [Pseudomonas cichorii]AHF68725.1 hypothetical protein PCH70_35720 [Pseudomonas cichorii JBC1]QVE15723.1 hypothetical protein KGD89_17760 [Pseudomonas cichorii]GFM90831.1 hypothetical protein PSCICP_08030 [Pseudomonas cichorii]SDN32233.1 hypothetical protein SAMN05216599_101617 [Pseudomonas cichorii]
MIMKPEFVRRLVDLSLRGNNSPAISVIIARRFARYLRDEGEAKRQYFKTEIATAKAALPFTATRLKDLELQQETTRDIRKKNLLGIANWLRRNDDLLVELYGFAGICDLLNVNPVHRAEALEYADESSGTVTTIAFICGLEDSASINSGRKRKDWNDGPLFWAYHTQMMQIMIDNPRAMPDPFAPGGPFYGMPTYYQQPDGTMARQSAPLTVHDAQGSRVVKRKIEVPRNGS